MLIFSWKVLSVELAIRHASSAVQRQALSDLYSTTSGAGLTILRNEISADPGSTIEPTAPSSPSAPPTYVPLSSVNDDQGQLNSVSCASVSFCVAVDSAGYALTWNGTAFSAPALVAAEPALAGTDASGLTGVSCPTPTFCRAVDSIGRVFGFDGTTWSKGTLIDNGHALSSVSCPSVSYCVAVDRSGNAFVSAAATESPNS